MTDYNTYRVLFGFGDRILKMLLIVMSKSFAVVMSEIYMGTVVCNYGIKLQILLNVYMLI